MATRDVLLEVLEERRRQEKKWGQQNHGAGYWALVLGEEVGEACKSALDNFTGETEDAQTVRRELIQVAAVAVNWIEAIDRDGP